MRYSTWVSVCGTGSAAPCTLLERTSGSLDPYSYLLQPAAGKPQVLSHLQGTGDRS